MKVILLQPHGYCAGVINAINIAKFAKKEHPNEPIYILGMLVHNDKVIEELTRIGIITLYRDDKSDEELLYSLKDHSVVVFSAHGHKKNLDEIAKEKDLIIYDATCPKVTQNIRMILEEVNAGHQVIYIGHKNHPEALAALSQDSNVFFYDIKEDNFDYKKIKDKSPLVINQTTLNTDDLKQIYIDIIVNKPHARIKDEICSATRLRQESIKQIDKEIDTIVVVGDKKSSNTKRLLEISQFYHPNCSSFLVKDVDELKSLIDIKNNHVIAVTSGASTPKKEIDKIINYLESI